MPKKIKRIRVKRANSNRKFYVNKNNNLSQKILSIVIPCVGIFIAIHFNGNQVPPRITAITKPGCNIKGNISQTSGKKIYHIPGMEDYESTVIDLTYGERWFCTESEAVANGWHKAPR